jgi:xylulokinase
MATDAYDQNAGRWSEELLDSAEVNVDLMPEVVPSTNVLGGLPRMQPLRPGLGLERRWLWEETGLARR